MTATTVACGIGSLAAAMVGAVSTCLTGPTNALVTASGTRERQYTAAIFIGLLAILFSLVAPTFTRLMLATPREFIVVLGGLAMLRVLQAAFVGAFRGKFSLGALVSLIVTVADITIGNIGAAFWGLIAGLLVAWLLEHVRLRRGQDRGCRARDRELYRPPGLVSGRLAHSSPRFFFTEGDGPN